MTTKTLYIAHNGKEFDSEAACYAYEHRYDAILSSDVCFFDVHHNLINVKEYEYDNLIGIIEDAYAIYIPYGGEEKVKMIHQLFRDEYIQSPWGDCTEPENLFVGYHYYDTSAEGKWVSLDGQLQMLNSIRDNLVRQVILNNMEE